MKFTTFPPLFFLFITFQIFAQTSIKYEISFENAVHHEAEVAVSFEHVTKDTLSVRMSRSSPGRYALHEFAKNVYGLTASDENGKPLSIFRPNPYQWDITGHKGNIKISYTLFANHGDGTYSQVDETHAHLNIPATFIYAPAYEQLPVQVKFHPREDLNWSVATQLKPLGHEEYYAPNLQYFMDSPVEISQHQIRSFKIESGGKEYRINFVLHQSGDFEGFDAYFEKVKKIVATEKDIFGSLPDFDYGAYYFLACYAPNVDGDGMEHRNSTILTDLKPLSQGGDKENIGTVAHEFFHAWNVERIRPASLEPFDFSKANMSGSLWFAEGFTSYYTNLTLCRAGIISKEYYANSLAYNLGNVWNSPARNFFNPVDMSRYAPFSDAATAVDQMNKENTFISYYSYGNVLGLALDLSLRNLSGNRSLDGFMRLMWEKFGKKEIPYSLDDLEQTLSLYAGNNFAHEFFEKYIYQSQMPDYKTLLGSVGIAFENRFENRPWFGAKLIHSDNKWLVNSNPAKGSSLYKAGLSKGDKIVSIDGKLTNKHLMPEVILSAYNPGNTVRVVFNRFDDLHETSLTFTKDPSFKTFLIPDPSKETLKKQNLWLNQSK